MRGLIRGQLAGREAARNLLPAVGTSHIMCLHFLQHDRQMCRQRRHAHADAPTQQWQHDMGLLRLNRSSDTLAGSGCGLKLLLYDCARFCLAGVPINEFGHTTAQGCAHGGGFCSSASPNDEYTRAGIAQLRHQLDRGIGGRCRKIHHDQSQIGAFDMRMQLSNIMGDRNDLRGIPQRTSKPERMN